MPQYHACRGLLEGGGWGEVWVMHLKVRSKLEEHNGKKLNSQVRESGGNAIQVSFLLFIDFSVIF